MEFGEAFPADGEAFERGGQGEGLLDDVAEFAQALDVRGTSAGDHRQDSALAQFAAVGLGVVTLVTEQGFGASPWAAGATRDGRHALDQSSPPAAFSSASRIRCSRSNTPACCHRSRRRQQV
ncbi:MULTISPECIES: hypothetical protein [Streptomyces]|uniref:Uncharacterized protein n=1 Tax=Streptomyces nymphaeiformis TaxID=2663842 RepID=A0A7W7UAL9_9ACTN|nr:hypothetical protein [Streptomyces nymphaeiformis]